MRRSQQERLPHKRHIVVVVVAVLLVFATTVVVVVVVQSCCRLCLLCVVSAVRCQRLLTALPGLGLGLSALFALPKQNTFESRNTHAAPQMNYLQHSEISL